MQYISVPMRMVSVAAAAAASAGRSGGVQPLVAAALLTAATGGSLLAVLPRPERALKQREALLLVVLAWFAAAGFGSLPFLWSGYFRSVTDAFFEPAVGVQLERFELDEYIAKTIERDPVVAIPILYGELLNGRAPR